MLLCLNKTQTWVAWRDSLPCLQAEHMLRQGRLQDADQLMAVRTSALPFWLWTHLANIAWPVHREPWHTSTELLSQHVPGGWACSAGGAACTFPSSCRQCHEDRACLAGSVGYACTHCRSARTHCCSACSAYSEGTPIPLHPQLQCLPCGVCHAPAPLLPLGSAMCTCTHSSSAYRQHVHAWRSAATVEWTSLPRLKCCRRPGQRRCCLEGQP